MIRIDSEYFGDAATFPNIETAERELEECFPDDGPIYLRLTKDGRVEYRVSSPPEQARWEQVGEEADS